MAISEGSTVKCNSGGPIMTVDNLDFPGKAECVWFDGNKQHRDSYSLSSLVEVTPAEPTNRESRVTYFGGFSRD